MRTPLTSIKGSLGLIKGGIVGELPAKLQSMIEIAHRNSNRLVHLVNDILDIERIEAGKLNFHMEPQSIMDLVEQAVDANRFYAEEHSTTLVIVESLEDAMIYGDGNRIEQVLANLLSNAAKFSSEGDDIEIRVSRQGPSIRVSVTDHGSGIPQDFRKLIFGKFAQADASDTRQKGGTGLGLSITKALVESHGGRIDFVTEEGSGTTFFIDLPEWAQPQGDLLVDAKGRVLICEDDPDIQQVLVSLLGDDGFDTDVAATATQAKAKLAGNTYVAMTLDIGLPDQDGIALIRELRNEEPTLVLPIVVVSATSSESHGVATGDAINIVDWIEKPIDNERLLRSVRHSQELIDPEAFHILHIENDADIAHIVSDVVASFAQVTRAGGMAEAKQHLRDGDFDLVILDLLLPDGADEELLPLLRGPNGDSTPVIIFSSKEVARQQLQGFEHMLIKSRTSNDLLLNTIRSAIARTRPGDRNDGDTQAHSPH